MGPGPRVLTVFLYLNNVEGGGATRFADLAYDESSLDDPTEFTKELSLDIYARKGTALIWPSVMSDDPNVRDDRTFHEALPVTKGVKYGANQWLHLRAYEGYDKELEQFS